ncbi:MULTISPECIES: DUF2790 domain-containing protein [unclassified Pseudomonas]|uniref:DUF2790 domain-containing protein n=1 Tax=Pseudomonas sp. MYb327 TaxID=2745230 RepID=A0AAU8E937_9PSED
MKKFLFFVLSVTAALSTYTQEANAASTVDIYKYGMPLDVAHVIEISPAADVCGPTPVRMTYNDSRGEVHILEFRVIGTGCTN